MLKVVWEEVGGAGRGRLDALICQLSDPSDRATSTMATIDIQSFVNILACVSTHTQSHRSRVNYDSVHEQPEEAVQGIRDNVSAGRRVGIGRMVHGIVARAKHKQTAERRLLKWRCLYPSPRGKCNDSCSVHEQSGALP